jgi:choline-phosphate cytidylyltransferase/glycerol-3-phosphate cytidylyltransferase
MIIGYTTGVFDLFHKGHVNLLRNAKSLCDKLIVGVSVDDLVNYKGKNPVIKFEDRLEVVRACRFVDLAVPQEDMNKLDAYNRYKFNLMFVGDDWYQSEKWTSIEESLTKKGIKIIYFPYTKGTSSTKINMILESIKLKK